MNSVQLILNGDGSTADLHERGLRQIHLGNGAPPIRITYLSGGMESGKPSCALVIELPGGKEYVLAEVSAQLLVTAAKAIEAKAKTEGFTL